MTAPLPDRRALVEVGAILGALLLLLGGRALGVGLNVPGGAQTACIALAFVGAVLARRGAGGVLPALGLGRPPGRGVALALLGTLPMALGLSLPEVGTTLGDHYETARSVFGAGPDGLPRLLRELARGAVLAAVAEELLLRGYAVRRLASAGLSTRAALVLPGAVFGLAHLPGAWHAGAVSAGLTVLLTGVGGVWFGWLYARWGWRVLVPMAAHMAMNAWWIAGAVGPVAASGGWLANGGRVAAIALITWGTLRWTGPITAPRAGQ